MKKLNHVKWSRDLLKIHISNCNSLNASPMCSRLTTFILHDSSLTNIPDSFFQYFEGLKILKISNCDRMEVLPDSISNLVNLVGLFIRRCDRLRYVSTLAMLKNLQSLEISYTPLSHIPNGLEKLSNLGYLNLISTLIKVVPPKIIPRLSNLRFLVCSISIEVRLGELMSLKNLDLLHVAFRGTHNLRAFVKHREQEGSPLINYKIEVFSDSYKIENSIFCDCNDWELGWDYCEKVVKLVDCDLCMPSRENDLYLLPKDVQVLIMDKIHDLTSLCTITFLDYATDLWFCRIANCKGVRELVTTSSSSSFALQSLQTLQLHDLDNLKSLICRKKAPGNVFPCLTELEIFACKRIKLLFSVGLLSILKNLKKLRVGWCSELEEIIEESLDNDKYLNEGMACVTLPKLCYLMLYDLPNLKSICPPTRRLICEALKEIRIGDCPELNQCVYAPLELDDGGQPSPSHCLQPIELKLCEKPIDWSALHLEENK